MLHILMDSWSCLNLPTMSSVTPKIMVCLFSYLPKPPNATLAQSSLHPALCHSRPQRPSHGRAAFAATCRSEPLPWRRRHLAGCSTLSHDRATSSRDALVSGCSCPAYAAIGPPRLRLPHQPHPRQHHTALSSMPSVLGCASRAGPASIALGLAQGSTVPLLCLGRGRKRKKTLTCGPKASVRQMGRRNSH